MSAGVHLQPHIQPCLCTPHKPRFTRCAGEHFYNKMHNDLKTISKTGWRHFSPECVWWAVAHTPNIFIWRVPSICKSSHKIYERKQNTNSTRTRGEKNHYHHKFMIHSNTNHVQHLHACFHQWAVRSGCSLSNNITSTCNWAAVSCAPSSSAGFQQKLKVLLHEPSLPYPTKRPNRMRQDTPKPKQMLTYHLQVSPQKPDEYIYQTVDQTEAWPYESNTSAALWNQALHSGLTNELWPTSPTPPHLQKIKNNTALKAWAARNCMERNYAVAVLNCKKNNPENRKQISHFSLSCFLLSFFLKLLLVIVACTALQAPFPLTNSQCRCGNVLFCRRLNTEWKKDKEEKRQERAITEHSDKKKKKSLDLKFIPKGSKRFFQILPHLKALTPTDAHERLNNSLVLSLQL